MPGNTIWISQLMLDPSLVKQLSSDASIADPMRVAETAKMWQAGVPFGEDRAPKELYHKYRDKKLKSVPDIFDGGGFIVLSQAMVDVLQQFDIGATRFFPVKVFEHDRTTRVGGAYHAISFREVKSAFVPEETTKAEKLMGREHWRPPMLLEDNMVALRPSAYGGVDLWLDADLGKAVFFSDPLVKALRAAKLTRRLRLKKARVIALN